MTREQRAALLRQRFKAIGGQPFIATSPRKPKDSAAPPRRTFPVWPEIVVDLKRAPLWFRQPLPRPENLLEAKAPNGMEIATAIERGWKEDGLLPEEDSSDAPGSHKTIARPRDRQESYQR